MFKAFAEWEVPIETLLGELGKPFERNDIENL